MYSPGFVVNCVDTTGAGDVFHGAFCYSVLKGASVRDALEFSNAMAALNCTRLGARGGIATADEARDLIERGERRSHPDYQPHCMIPLRSSERVYSRTVVTGSLIALNTVIFLYQNTLSYYRLDQFVTNWGIVPDDLRLITLFTSMFLHGGWLHLLGNMLFLWVFGRNLEDLIGGTRFLAFYLVCGLVAGVVQVLANPYARVPTIGASGAIAGVMGAYLIKFPRSQIDTLVLLFVFFTRLAIPAPFYLLFWFGMQFLNGFETIGDRNYSGGGVAVFAHIGGFIAGMLLIRLFPSRQRWRHWYEES